jgi:hypothetical protein
MKYLYTRFFWITSFGIPDVSLGLHLSMKGRIDIHFIFWMFSIGNVPIYQIKNGSKIAVANSYHSKKFGPIRAGNP